MLNREKQEMMYDMIISDMAQFSDHVVLTSLKDILYDIETGGDEDWFGTDPEELKDAVRILIEWYGVLGQDFG